MHRLSNFPLAPGPTQPLPLDGCVVLGTPNKSSFFLRFGVAQSAGLSPKKATDSVLWFGLLQGDPFPRQHTVPSWLKNKSRPARFIDLSSPPQVVRGTRHSPTVDGYAIRSHHFDIMVETITFVGICRAARLRIYLPGAGERVHEVGLMWPCHAL